VLPINVTAWNAAEIFRSFGTAACNVGGRHAAIGLKALERASKIYIFSRSRPFILNEQMWNDVRNSFSEEARLTMSEVPLMSLPPDIEVVVREMASRVVGG
jgi:hypothetical protein